MSGFSNAGGESVVRAMIASIKEHAAELSEIDGAIGDGDHGINMKKGFSMAEERLAGEGGSFTEALKTLGRVLLAEIGGSMGPLYGSFFTAMARAGKGAEVVDEKLFVTMLERAVGAVTELGGAKVGDKTLIDALAPALEAYRRAVDEGLAFADALDRMADAAEHGRDSTRDLVAKLGRSARLGERSRGVLDAGAASCALLLRAVARSARPLIT